MSEYYDENGYNEPDMDEEAGRPDQEEYGNRPDMVQLYILLL